MTAMTAAGGTRCYLQSRRWAWLTEGRLRRVTIAVFVLGGALAMLLP